MRRGRKFSLFATLALLIATLAVAPPAGAGHKGDPATQNLKSMGHIEEPASLLTGAGGGNIHTDIAFQGKYAFQGSWLGFNIRNIAAPGNPKQVSFTSCTGNQGDVLVFEDILVRSWNSPAALGATCDGTTVEPDFEGLHVFDISNLNDPVLVGSVATPCGSHTATAVPDPDNGRLLVYNSSSSVTCPGIDIVEVPLNNPAAAFFVRTEPALRGCHDTSVILGDAMLAACAGGDGYTMFSLSGSGSLTDPELVYSRSIPDIGIGHGTTFSWDGQVVVFAHEPGGGIQANCQESSSDTDKSAFFFDTATGDLLGTWVLPRPQSNIENCTIHNFNVVPLTNGNKILVSGSYQSGTSVVDFTDPANAVEIAYSDPAPIPPPGGPFCGGLGCEIGGVWSSHWYNNFIYESNITEGLNVFRFSGNQTAGALRLDHLNPQTQMFTID